MRTLPLLAVGLTLLLTGAAYADASIPHLNQVATADLSKVASGALPATQASLSYRYTNQWGVDKLWQLRGNTLLFQKSIHTSQYVDQARQTITSGGSLTGLESGLLDLPYGNYDKYFQGSLTPAEVSAVYKQLAGLNLPNVTCEVGCGQNSWTIEVSCAGKLTQLFDVNAAGNPSFKPVTDYLETLFDGHDNALTEITRDAYLATYSPTIPAAMQGRVN
ncbi:MAG: hypothetical protein ABI743_04495 [bacterium]